MKFNEQRMLRLNGEQPTKRERWVAFYRLWRTAHNDDLWSDSNSCDCFRVLFDDYYDWISLLNASVEQPRKGYPISIRRRLLEYAKRRRIFGQRYEWLEKSQEVSHRLRQTRGIEMTPEEVAEARCGVFRRIREECTKRGIEVPADDVGLFRVLRMSAAANGGEQ